MANETDIKLFETDGESKGGEKVVVRNFRTTTTKRDKHIFLKRKLNENSTVRNFRTVAGQARMTYNVETQCIASLLQIATQVFFNHYVQKSQKILIFLNILMISHSKINLL